MTTNQALSAANKLFYQAVRNGRQDTIETIGQFIWHLVAQQVRAELAGEPI